MKGENQGCKPAMMEKEFFLILSHRGKCKGSIKKKIKKNHTEIEMLAP